MLIDSHRQLEAAEFDDDRDDVLARARAAGVDFLLLSPLHAPAPGIPQEPSPYFPSSRVLRNPLHLRVEGVSLPNDPAVPIDRDAVWKAKTAALEREYAYASLGPDTAPFDAWVQSRIDDQLSEAAHAGAGLVHDIAVGFDPAGADAAQEHDGRGNQRQKKDGAGCGDFRRLHR